MSNNNTSNEEQLAKRISILENTLVEVKFFLNGIHDSSLRGSYEDVILQAVHGKTIIERVLK